MEEVTKVRKLDENGYQVCFKCEESACSLFDVDDNEDLPPDKKCHLCDPDVDECEFCASMR